MYNLISNNLNTALLLGIAGIQCLTAYQTYRTMKISKMTELNTNSMKDALIASTKLASYAEGKAAGELIK